MEGRLFFVNQEVHLGLPLFHKPIHIHHPGCLLKYCQDFLSNLSLTFIIGTIDLCNQGRQYRRTGGDLCNFHPGIIPVCNQF